MSEYRAASGDSSSSMDDEMNRRRPLLFTCFAIGTIATIMGIVSMLAVGNS